MKWIDGFAKASFKLYAGNTLSAFQPLDFFHFYPLWYDLWVKRFMSVMDVLGCDHKPYEELKGLLPTPSNMRAILQKLIPTYAGIGAANPKKFARMANFFARMLKEACPEDPFGLTSNPFHSQKNLNDLIAEVPWQKADPVIAKKLGQLLAASGSFVHGLYNDVVTDFSWETYGPYNINTPEKKSQMLIRHFSNLRPSELWGDESLTPAKEVKIFQFYEDVKWEIACVGCHTVLKSGDPIQNLKYFAIAINDQFVKHEILNPVIGELSEKAVQIYEQINKMNFEELKKLVMRQECFQLKKMFEAAYMNWLPTSEMIERVETKPLIIGLLPLGKLMTNEEEYKELFHINRFAREVLDK